MATASGGQEPPGLGRRDHYAQQTRQAVLDSALECFSTLGYVGSSLEEVARRAQVTRGAVYHHFHSKAQLFEAVFEQLERSNVERLRAATQGADAGEQARSAVAAFLDLCAQDPFRTIVMREGPLALGCPDGGNWTSSTRWPCWRSSCGR